MCSLQRLISLNNSETPFWWVLIKLAGFGAWPSLLWAMSCYNSFNVNQEFVLIE